MDQRNIRDDYITAIHDVFTQVLRSEFKLQAELKIRPPLPPKIEAVLLPIYYVESMLQKWYLQHSTLSASYSGLRIYLAVW